VSYAAVSLKAGPLAIDDLLRNRQYFVTERIAGLLKLPKTKRAINISGIAASSTGKSTQMVTSYLPSMEQVIQWMWRHLYCPTKDLPSGIHPSWTHLEEVNLADPTFGKLTHS
jgi:hypothetical protein